MSTRSYSELLRLNTFEERFAYLSIKARVSERTFGGDRWHNQQFYRSKTWKQTRDAIIVRDNGCDLGIEDFPISEGLLIHHINPITLEDLLNGTDAVFDPENLITTCHKTHNAIHYGDPSLVPRSFGVSRERGDTKLW